MYKKVLLTDNELVLLRKAIGSHLGNQKDEIRASDLNNLHIIDRVLFGLIPTKCVNEYVNKG